MDREFSTFMDGEDCRECSSLRSSLSESQALNTAQAKKIAELMKRVELYRHSWTTRKAQVHWKCAEIQKLEKENARLKELVESVERSLRIYSVARKDWGRSHPSCEQVCQMVDEALSKIAEFKEGRK